MKKSTTILIPLSLLIGLFVFSSGARVNAAEPTFYGINVTSEVTSVHFVSGTTWHVEHPRIEGCTGTIYGTSNIYIGRWNGTEWVDQEGSASTCYEGKYHSTENVINVSAGTGTYAIFFYSSGDFTNSNRYIELYYENGILEAISPTLKTSIISTIPTSKQILNPTTTGSSTIQFYKAYTDTDKDLRHLAWITHTKNGVITLQYLTEGIGRSAPELEEGINIVSSSTLNYNDTGKYSVEARICELEGFWIFSTCSEIIDSKSIEFYIGTTTSEYDNQVMKGKEELDALMASSTAQMNIFCNPLNLSSFSFSSCLSYTIYPGDAILSEDIRLLKAIPPWGYVFRLKDIVEATSTASLPTLSFVVPPGIPGTGASFTFDPTHKLDYILNATTSQFTNASASSTKTFYEITEPYWKTIITLGLLLYVMLRIMGSHLIPKIKIK